MCKIRNLNGNIYFEYLCKINWSPHLPQQFFRLIHVHVCACVFEYICVYASMYVCITVYVVGSIYREDPGVTYIVSVFTIQHIQT